MAQFGRTADAGARDIGPDYKFVTRFQNDSGESFSVRSMHYLGLVDATDNARLVIYDSAGNYLGRTEELPENVGEWQGVNMETPVPVTAGAFYRLGMHAGTVTRCTGVYRSTTHLSYENSDTYSDGPSDPFGADVGTDEWEMCVYASSEPIGGSVSDDGGAMMAAL